MTMPAGAAVAGDQQRLALADEQLDGLAHRVVGGDGGQRRLHDVDDLGAEQRGVRDGVLEQAALADRADDRVRVVRGDDRQLRDAVLVQQRDGVADVLVGCGR